MPTRLTILLLALVLLPAAAPPPPVPVYRRFGRWLVACDNTRACVARGFDETTRAQLQLTRAAGNARPMLTLFAENAIDARRGAAGRQTAGTSCTGLVGQGWHPVHP